MQPFLRGDRSQTESRAGETVTAFHSLRCEPRNQGGMSLMMLIYKSWSGVCVCLAGSGVRGAPCLGHCTG